MGARSEPFSLSSDAWPGWVVAIIGAVLVLCAFGALKRRKWWQ
jgi:uncharacterized membrane protein YeaQ/YmgE (transglycosylase-associated protein family)